MCCKNTGLLHQATVLHVLWADYRCAAREKTEKVMCSSCSAYQSAREADNWLTKNHSKGWCAMYGVCADRKDGGSLNCPSNIPAPPAEKQAADILQTLCPDLWASSGASNGASMHWFLSPKVCKFPRLSLPLCDREARHCDSSEVAS